MHGKSFNTLMCFGMSKKCFIRFVLFPGQFDPPILMPKATLQTQNNKMYWLYFVILVFYNPMKQNM